MVAGAACSRLRLADATGVAAAPAQPRPTTQLALQTVIELRNDFGGLLVDAYGPMI
jgi:hypothetical protein